MLLATATEVSEPAWTRGWVNARGEFGVEQARQDNRFGGPPSDPLVYGDVVVTHPEGSAWLHASAGSDGAAAAGAADGKHRRYPAWALPGGRLVPFAVETLGGGVRRLSNGSGGPSMPSQKPIHRSRQRVIGGK